MAAGRIGAGSDRLSITHGGESGAALVLTESCNADIPDRSLELDQRMSLIVGVAWVCLAVGAEINIVADRTFVPHSSDVGLLRVPAKRSIAINAKVACLGKARDAQGLVNGHKSVATVCGTSTLYACQAVVPVWASETLVANTKDRLRALVEGFAKL